MTPALTALLNAETDFALSAWTAPARSHCIWEGLAKRAGVAAFTKAERVEIAAFALELYRARKQMAA